jgi:hypothetical protein
MAYTKIGGRNQFDFCNDDHSYRVLDHSFDFGKDAHRSRLKFVDAHHKLMKNSLFKSEIQTNIKHEAEALRLCGMFQQLANKETQNLYCYVEYASLEAPLDIERFTVYLCNFDNTSAIRKECIYQMIRDRLNGDSNLILLQSMSSDYILKVGGIVLKDLLKPFQLLMAQRFFNQYGPHYKFFVLYIDTTQALINDNSSKSNSNVSGMFNSLFDFH